MTAKDAATSRRQHVHFVAGACSGIMSASFLQPLDVVKTRMVMASRTQLGATRSGCFALAHSIASSEGVLALWKGLSPTLLRIAGGCGLYFLCLNHILPDRPNVSTAHALAAGAAARAVAATLMCPIAVVKTRFEASSAHQYRGVFNAISMIARIEGARGLYSGLFPTLARDMPFSAMYVLFYTRLRVFFQSIDMSMLTEVQASLAISFASGAIAGGTATALTHPMEVLKTKAQMNRHLSESRLGMFDSFRNCIATEGFSALFRGIVPRILKRSLSNALTWTMYEQVVFLVDNVL